MTSRSGRRPGDPEVTRQAILVAARDAFASRGYDRATIRAIGASAGVDPALVHHHFGTKEQLFAAAHELPYDPDRVIEEVMEGDPDRLGERVARFYLSLMGGGDSPGLSLLRSAATNPEAATMLREFLESFMLPAMSERIGGDDAELRVALAASHMVGLIMGRTILGVAPLSDLEPEVLIERVAPVLQAYLTGDP